MAGPTTAGLAAQIQGEPWRYVGDTDQPAFENGWQNLGGSMSLAFRIRTAGVIDIYGAINNGTPGATIFTVPEDYRPNEDSSSNNVNGFITSGGGSQVLASVTVAADGSVSVQATPDHPDTVAIFAQIFLVVPELAP